MRNIRTLLGASAAALAIYAFLFALKRNWFPAEIVLTEGLIMAAAFLPALALLLLLWRAADAAIRLAVFLIAFLGVLVFNLSIPAIFDRSVTLYLLNNMDNRGAAGMTLADARAEFLAVYFAEEYAIRKRLDEQVHGGNLTRVSDAAGENDRYRITERGRRMITVARWISRIYNLDPRIVAKRKRHGD